MIDWNVLKKIVADRDRVRLGEWMLDQDLTDFDDVDLPMRLAVVATDTVAKIAADATEAIELVIADLARSK